MNSRARRAPTKIDAAPQLELLDAVHESALGQQQPVGAIDRLGHSKVVTKRHSERGLPRLSVGPDEAAEMLGVSRDFFDEHIIHELRVVRRGRRLLIALAELERWLDRSAAIRGSIERRTRVDR